MLQIKSFFSRRFYSRCWAESLTSGRLKNDPMTSVEAHLAAQADGFSTRKAKSGGGERKGLAFALIVPLWSPLLRKKHENPRY